MHRTKIKTQHRPYSSPALIKIRALSHRVTWFLGTRFPETIPLTFVIGYPKCGTSWASQLVSDYLQLPYPRFSILPITFPAVVHGHAGIWETYSQAMYVVRDPRDAMISRYYYAGSRLSALPKKKQERIYRERRMNPDYRTYVSENLPQFIERLMTKALTHGMNWAQHVRTYLDRKNDRVGLLRYEELLTNGPSHLAQALEQMTGEPADMERVQQAIDRYSFAKQSGRKAGQEDRSSFLRKGQAGDWRNHFTREAAEVLDRYCGEVMLEIGYIENRDWVQECPPLREMAAAQ